MNNPFYSMMNDAATNAQQRIGGRGMIMCSLITSHQLISVGALASPEAVHFDYRVDGVQVDANEAACLVLGSSTD